jgi:DNA-binding transcriptional LysR family regulator
VAELAVVASKAAHFKEPMTNEDYAAAAQVVVRPARPDKLPIDSPLVDLGLARRETIVTPFTMAVPSLLAANPDMIATVPAELADVALGAGVIRRLATTFQFPEVPILQFWHRRYHSERFNVWLRSMMRKSIVETIQSSRLNRPPRSTETVTAEIGHHQIQPANS